MTDYSKMSDFEINGAIAKQIGGEILFDEYGAPYRLAPCAISAYSGIDFDEVDFDPCNNPADAWPIIEQNYISLTFDGISWDASSALSEITYNAWKTHPYQPLRLAMIVFLMMKGAEK